ncbi:hypothetical protein H257_11913 [Aphanomyces astaci]|uniref:Uncharacterized protein n=1 Tax=Aphanomyces astaci TaxID=112090 RepID=W4G2E6_APHAT|nr:hypothetical protein, variant [Aphanomyces astaci]XP_009837294.1 hypothetical protein H257_11913 [Aphanomyces astaci]ETV73088.1 hypothetical protein H257_11913 [Aphanomyces astaci]ETV73089.1 hypothetical protein, variant [Aphanomyces astaci]|eukprot:XP_009837293.1 hypothetical protein, variant [Aphanomyces astaci]
MEARAIGAGAITALDTAVTTVRTRPNGKGVVKREVSSSDAGDDGRPSKRAKSTPASPKLQPSGNEFKRIPKNPRTSLSQLPPVQSVPGEMLDVCEEVRVTKPWERYRRAGSILLDQDGREGQHEPQFHNSVATFWDRYGQQLWEQTYAPFGNPNHLDPLFHQVFNLHVKLQRLINNTDYDDTHAHFLCFPHPPWSV